MVSSHPAKRIPGMSEEEYFTLLPVLGKKTTIYFFSKQTISQEWLTQITFYKDTTFRTHTFLEQNIFDLDFHIIYKTHH